VRSPGRNAAYADLVVRIAVRLKIPDNFPRK